MCEVSGLFISKKQPLKKVSRLYQTMIHREDQGATPGTCQGVKNPGENNTHDKYSTCCLKTVSEDGNPVDTYVCTVMDVTKPDSDGNGRGCSKVRLSIVPNSKFLVNNGLINRLFQDSFCIN